MPADSRGTPPNPRVLLVLPTSTYRAHDFLDAARAVGAEVVVASEEEQALGPTMGDRFVRVDLCDPIRAAQDIVDTAQPIDAVVGVDEQGVMVAAHVAAKLGLAHNPPRAVAVTRDKALMRIMLTDAGLDQPAHRLVTSRDEVASASGSVGYPCVVKPVNLAASRGVIRANNEDEATEAAERVWAILAEDGDDGSPPILIEGYVPGAEVAVEGLLRDGSLEVLAVFDKPDPLEGPYFEETMYVTPSRLADATQTLITGAVARACAVIGLVEGPVHAELRLPDDRPVVLEVAGRSIGGLCSRSLRFGAGISLEEVIVRNALSIEPGDLRRTRAASGVMMIPIRRSGRLVAIDGLDEARAVECIDGVEVTVPVGHSVRALPEGNRYLGFMFASAQDPATVERSLRDAHARLRIVIDDES